MRKLIDEIRKNFEKISNKFFNGIEVINSKYEKENECTIAEGIEKAKKEFDEWYFQL